MAGLGAVHIRQRESLPDQFAARLQGGNFDTGRGFLGFSPDARGVDSYIAHVGSYTNGHLKTPAATAGITSTPTTPSAWRTIKSSAFAGLFGRNNFHLSGQLPLYLVSNGELDRFGFIDPSLGGRVKLATGATYYSREFDNGGVLKADGFVSRSLFDLLSNFTF